MTGLKIGIAVLGFLALSARVAPAQGVVPGGWEAGFSHRPGDWSRPAGGVGFGYGFSPYSSSYGYGYGSGSGQVPPTFVRGPRPGFRGAAAATDNQLVPFSQGLDRSLRPSRRGR